MIASAVWRGLVRLALLRPTVWALALGVGIGVPISALLHPWPVREGAPGNELLLAWALPVGLVGVGLAFAHLAGHEAFLRMLSPRSRWAGELGGLALGALGFEGALVLGSLLAGTLPAAGVLIGLLLLSLHLAALGFLLLQWKAPIALRVAALVSLAAVGPELLGGGGGWSRWAVLVDAGAHPQAWTAFVAAPLAALSGLLAVVALLAVGPGLVCARRPRRGSP